MGWWLEVATETKEFLLKMENMAHLYSDGNNSVEE